MADTKKDLIEATEELNKLAGRAVYIATYDGSMLATTRLADLNTALKEDDVILNFGDDPQDFCIYYGLILDPLVLPEKLPSTGMYHDFSLILISYDNYTTVKTQEYGHDIDEVIEILETTMEADEIVNIEDFSILFGRKIDFMLQVKSPGASVMNKEGMVICQKTTG